MFVIEDSIQVRIPGGTISLEKGDSIRFVADSAHEIENAGNSPAELLDIVCYPLAKDGLNEK